MIYFSWFLIYLLVVLDLPGWPLRTPQVDQEPREAGQEPREVDQEPPEMKRA